MKLNACWNILSATMSFIIFILLSCFAHCKAAEKNYGEFCQVDDTCKGETFCNLAKNCQYGRCECKEGYTVNKIGNSCKKLKKIGESCTDETDCGFRVICSNNICSCGPKLSASENKTYCDKHVGDPCTGDIECNWGDSMQCIDEKCACSNPYKEYRKQCIPYELGEECREAQKCVAGSCQQDKCTCRSEQIPYLQHYCVYKDAIVNLKHGDQCYHSAVVETARYCSKGLVCQQCPNEIKYVCMSGETSKQNGSDGKIHFFNLLLLIIPLSAPICFSCIN